eukprot:TRINITY_DN40596_c0_g1_i1.p1 TRINITY_DN40596_c0_g1~~TRINITY_DN40596_c0_g1_i1.p1  ORF type:complete len:263 (-),score=30.94 TRINITY_DN40596_c0_g1_i1:261-1049(-)
MATAPTTTSSFYCLQLSLPKPVTPHQNTFGKHCISFSKRPSSFLIYASSETAAVQAEPLTANEEGQKPSKPRRRRRRPIIPRLKGEYFRNVVPRLKEEFSYSNVHQIPKLEKIVVNCGIGDIAQNAKALERAVRDLSMISGQWPVKTRAKRAVSSFKIRKGSIVGLAVTLRRRIMYDFLDRVINIALPRSRDFQGVTPYGFDGNGNYNLGVIDHSMFPEIDVETLETRIGMNISIKTTAKTDIEAYKLLFHLGMPFNDGLAN